MKKDLPYWIASDFECMVITVDDPDQKQRLLVIKSVVGYNIVRTDNMMT